MFGARPRDHKVLIDLPGALLAMANQFAQQTRPPFITSRRCCAKRYTLAFLSNSFKHMLSGILGKSAKVFSPCLGESELDFDPSLRLVSPRD
jgi:hypothetical protein